MKSIFHINISDEITFSFTNFSNRHYTSKHNQVIWDFSTFIQ